MFLGKFLHEFCLVLGFSSFSASICFYNVYKKGSYKKKERKRVSQFTDRGYRDVLGEMLKKYDVFLRFQALLQY